MAADLATPPGRLHEMNRLEDMGRFPLVVYLGATFNVLIEVAFFYWLNGRVSGYLPIGFPCAVILVACNLLPVIVLRRVEGAEGLADTPRVEGMNFARDQHRFASWVYAVASGNLFFWLMLAWTAFDLRRSPGTLLLVETLAFFCTLLPIWRRLLKRGPFSSGGSVGAS